MSEKWKEVGGISEIFWTKDHQYAFQRVGDVWNLYGGYEGYFVKEFRSFVDLQIYIWENRKEKSK